MMLIAIYLVTLLFSVFKFKSNFAEELKLFGWYFMVGLLAAIWTHDNEFYFRRDAMPCDDCPTIDINLIGIFRAMWQIVIRPYALAFVCLSAPRHWVLTFQHWRKDRVRNP